jgi:FkbM family methyltransferase
LCPAVSKHSVKSFSAALFKKSFYLAFLNIFICFKSPLKVLIRYVFEVGGYPRQFFIRTPLGLQCATAFSHHDLITLVECFGKLDYKVSQNISVVVDFGSNIGISALYFLTRNTSVQVYLFEPVPRNIQRLRENLKGYENRYKLTECAIGIKEGEFDFTCEDTGRYGGLIEKGVKNFSSSSSGRPIKVKVLLANHVLGEIIEKHKNIDVVKIDVEGYENKILSSLKKEILSCLGRIYAETENDQTILGFSSERYGGLTRYYRS